MVSVITQKYSSANMSYSSSRGQISHRGWVVPQEFTINDSRRCVREGLVYEEVKQQYPGLKEARYKKLLKECGAQSDRVRMKERIDRDIVELSNQGATPEQIAEKYEWKVPYCRRRLDDLGVKTTTLVFTKKEPAPQKLVDRIRQFAEKGLSQKKIAKKIKRPLTETVEIMRDNEILTEKAKMLERIGDLKKSTLANALAEAGGNIKAASEHLQISVAVFKKYASMFKII